MPCYYTGPAGCSPQTVAPSGQCNKNCPNGQNCQQNLCVANNTISGNVYVDTNVDTYKDNGEANYTGSATFNFSSGASFTTTNGSFTFNDLLPGTYTVTYTNPPTGSGGYSITYPLNGPPPSLTVTVGSGCSANGAHDATCTSGNIINLDFGITNNKPWFQGVGGDTRIDPGGFIDKIPTSAVGGAYANLNGGGGTPGLVFTGNATPDFGQGQPSSTSWLSGGLSYPESYSPIRLGGQVRTSYNFLLSRAAQGNITPVDISAYCSGGIANCTLSGSLPHGIYKANGNLNLVGGGYTFGANQSFVIVINGDLTISENIKVPVGSTAIFASSGNINVASSVGETTASSTSTDIEGVYSADKSFTAQGNNSCSVGTDKRLNIAGTVITNAGQLSGSFVSQRDLCGQDPFYPTIQIQERPDFIINTPNFLKVPNYTYQEIAP